MIKPVSACQRLLLSLSLSLLCSYSAAESNTEQPLTVRPQWQTGDKAHYLLTKSRARTIDGARNKGVTSKTDVWFEVLKVQDDHYVLSVNFGETRFDDPNLNADPLTKGMTSLRKGLKIILTLNRDGSIREVQNWEEIQKVSNKAIDRLSEHLKGQGAPTGAIDKVIAQVRHMFSSEEVVTQTATQEIQLLFVPLGKTYEISTPLEYETEIPNILGGEPIPSQGKFTLTAFDQNNGQATITWAQSVNSKEFTRIMNGTLQSMAKSIGKPMPDAKRLDSMSINDSGEFVVDVRSGWSTALTYTRRVGAASASQEDTTSMTKQP